MANTVALRPRIGAYRKRAQLNTRIPPDLKREVYSIAVARREPLQAVVEDALQQYIRAEGSRVFA